MLPLSSYQPSNIFCWGLASDHYAAAGREGCSLSGVVHFTLALFETFPPILSQLISLIDALISLLIYYFFHETPAPQPASTPTIARPTTPITPATSVDLRPPLFAAQSKRADIPSPDPHNTALRNHYNHVFHHETKPALIAGGYTLLGERVELDLSRAKAETTIYTPTALQNFHQNAVDYGALCPIEFAAEDSLAGAYHLMDQGYRVAVLNMANEFKPGGGVKGFHNLAQEEALSRRSGLMAAIDPELNPHLKAQLNNGVYHIPEDGCIHSPHVPIFRSEREDHTFTWFTSSQIRYMGVISSAAVDLRNANNSWNTLSEYGKALTKAKIRSQIQTAILHRYDALDLSAFGCGAFGNDPTFISGLYRDILINEGYARYFRAIRFSILTITDRDRTNFSTFTKTFNP